MVRLTGQCVLWAGKYGISVVLMFDCCCVWNLIDEFTFTSKYWRHNTLPSVLRASQSCTYHLRTLSIFLFSFGSLTLSQYRYRWTTIEPKKNRVELNYKHSLQSLRRKWIMEEDLYKGTIYTEMNLRLAKSDAKQGVGVPAYMYICTYMLQKYLHGTCVCTWCICT
jgi:hypothetical protein